MAQHRNGVSNIEIDWFLRGKLPEATTPMPTPHKHVDIPSPGTPPPQDTPIHEGLTHVQSTQDQMGHVLSRSKSLSEAELRSDKKSGFFRSFFNKKKRGDESTDTLPTPLSGSRQPSPSPTPHRSHSIDANSLKKSKTASSAVELDPRLEEFLRYYKAKGLDKLQKDTKQHNTGDTTSPPERKKASFGINDNSDTSSVSSSIQSSIAEKPTAKSKKVDALGRPIPPHPERAPLPPAIIKNSHFETNLNVVDQATQNPSAMTSTSRLTGFLRRHHNSISENSLSRAASITSSGGSGDKAEHKKHASSTNPSHKEPVVIPGLENLPRLKRVCFDVPVFFNDPPQQIPSRTPRKGEVEILKDGSIVIHKLTAAERRQMAQSGGGIVVGGTGHLKVIAKPEGVAPTAEPTSEKPIVELNKPGQEHSITVAAAAAAAEARGKAGGNELKRISTNNDEDVTVNTTATKISIDKPMVRHTKSSISLKSLENHTEDAGVFPPQNIKVPLDILYTRCCHLREILPIPATLKQLKAGSTDPISVLQLRNPKPSLVEVLTFSDFVSVAPVLCISLDSVSLSSEMFRIILSALAHKPEFEKLTLRNTPIDEMGWKLLCWFLTKNRTLSRLDLTQVPSLHTTVQKPAKTVATSNVSRMQCEMENRSDMNWMLMSATLAARGGIEELVINGAKMNDEEFRNLIELGVSIRTTKLGLAYNDLTLNQVQAIADNVHRMKLIGLDIGYNDLSDKLDPLVNAVKLQVNRDTSLQFLSLNSCNLDNDDKQLERVFTEFTVFKDLKYIDLSNNKRLFPSVMLGLAEWLPIYPKLARIHLDYNDLNQRAIVAFAELIPFCKSMRYISLIGNKIDAVSAGALANAVKLSNTVMTLDIDYEDVAPKYRESIGIHTVRNMQNDLYKDSNGKNIDGKNEMDGLREQLSELLLHDGEDPDPVIVEGFIQKAMKLRERIHETIEELFHLRLQGKLNVEGKEALIRFCFVDASIEKGLNLLNRRSYIQEIFHRLESSPKKPDTPIGDHRKLLGSALQSPGSRTSLSSTEMTRHSSTNLVHCLESPGNAALMPFGPTSDYFEDFDATAHPEPLREDNMDANGRASDVWRLKEEASALKIAGMLRENNVRANMSQENIDTIDSMSGEQLREMIVKTNDYRNISDVLARLKEKGIPIGDIYTKKDDPLVDNGMLDMETLRNTAKNVDRNTIVSDDEDSDSGSESTNSVESTASEDQLGQAYDEILDHIEKVRTNT